MSPLVAAGWSTASRQGVSVVPMIQCRPQGMTNSTDFSVRRISPEVEVKRSRGTTRWMPLAAVTLGIPAITGSSVPFGWRSGMDPVHTPVALMTRRACTVSRRPLSRSRTSTPVMPSSEADPAPR